MVTRRSAEEPAYVLHRYDWSESSLVLEVFTRHHGRIALVAKGVKRPTSQFRPVLAAVAGVAAELGWRCRGAHPEIGPVAGRSCDAHGRGADLGDLPQ